jgi:hypothetical protein
MAPRRRIPTPTTADDRQSSLFDRLYPLPEPPRTSAGALGCAARICGLVSHALDYARTEGGLTRAMVAARMAELTGERITEATLNAITAESHELRFPLQWLAALVEATGCTDPLVFVAQQVGALVLIGQEALDARLGQVQRQVALLKREEARIKQQMEGRHG